MLIEEYFVELFGKNHWNIEDLWFSYETLVIVLQHILRFGNLFINLV